MARRRFAPTSAVLLSLALASVAVGAEPPVAVSPGHPSKLALVEARCPTFSWGEVDRAESYELVVYRVGELGEQEEPVLQQSFAGTVDSWTPSLDSCLARGGQYAWSVRAVGGRDTSEWSSPSLFEVAAGPSESEFEAAVEVVRQYLEQQDADSTNTQPENAGPSSGPAPSAVGIPVAGKGVSPPLSAAAGDLALQVNGSPVVTVATLEAGCLGRRWLDQGDGTVLDCNTRLIWLKDAGCLGTGSWGASSFPGDTVQSKVFDFNFTGFGSDFGCTDYTEGTYTDWRVPTIEELCSAGETAQVCPAANWQTSLMDTRFPGEPKVSNADGNGLWFHGDPFVRVQSPFYWSSTPHPDLSSFAWTVTTPTGAVSFDSHAADGHVWPVRDGP